MAGSSDKEVKNESLATIVSELETLNQLCGQVVGVYSLGYMSHEAKAVEYARIARSIQEHFATHESPMKSGGALDRIAEVFVEAGKLKRSYHYNNLRPLENAVAKASNPVPVQNLCSDKPVDPKPLEPKGVFGYFNKHRSDPVYAGGEAYKRDGEISLAEARNQILAAIRVSDEQRKLRETPRPYYVLQDRASSEYYSLYARDHGGGWHKDPTLSLKFVDESDAGMFMKLKEMPPSVLVTEVRDP